MVLISGGYMFKNTALVLCFVGCLSYTMEPPANTAKATLDISREKFGLNSTYKNDVYIEALREFAQALLMQHRLFEASLDAVAIREKINRLERLGVDANMIRQAWVNHVPNGQEIRQALMNRQNPEFLVRTPSEDFLFAGTPDGITYLSKYRSLFMQDTIDLKYRPLITKMSIKGRQENNQDLNVFALILSARLETTQLRAEINQQTERLKACHKDFFDYGLLLNKNYPSLSPELHACFTVTANLSKAALQDLAGTYNFAFMSSFLFLRMSMRWAHQPTKKSVFVEHIIKPSQQSMQQ